MHYCPTSLDVDRQTQMTEIVAIKALMEFHVLEAIPLEGSISLADASKATGVQDKLLG